MLHTFYVLHTFYMCCPAAGVPARWRVAGDAPGAWAPGALLCRSSSREQALRGLGSRDPDSRAARCAGYDRLVCCVERETWTDGEARKSWGPESYTAAVWCKPVNTGQSLLQFLRASAQSQPATAALWHCTVIQWFHVDGLIGLH
jgi:hypothetical protein